MQNFEKRGEFFKADDQGIVYGWAIVCTEAGVPYVDLQGDHIPVAAMLDAAADFAKHSRVGKDMHAGESVGEHLFLYPVTKSSASLGVDSSREGLLVGFKPNDPALIDLVRSGERTGFSIGGTLSDSVEEPLVKAAIEKAAGNAKTRRTFRTFKIHEISLVDRPAQAGATVGYVKNAAGAVVLARRADVAKTDTVDCPSCGKPEPADATTCPDCGAAMTKRADLTFPGVTTKQLADAIAAREAAARAVSPTTKGGADITDASKSPPPAALPHLGDMKLVVLTESQHAHYSKLAGDEADAFIAKSHSDREVIVKAALDADPIVYEGKLTGTSVRKSDGQLAKKLAEQNEKHAETIAAQTAEIAKANDARQVEFYKARAKTDMANLPGSEADKIDLAKRLDDADVTKRDALMAIVKGGNAAIAMLGKTTGSTDANGDPGAAVLPSDTLRKHVEKYQTDHKIPTYEQAFAKAVREDAEAQRLYNAARN